MWATTSGSDIATGKPVSVKGSVSRTDAGTVVAISSSIESKPRSASMATVSSESEPRCRPAKLPIGAALGFATLGVTGEWVTDGSWSA